MKILLISPVIAADKTTPESLTIPQLALHILAGLTPEEHEVEIIEEEHELVDFNTDCDVVGISILTSNAMRGYDIARKFKELGKIIVLGGIHATVLPDEAIKHADTVVVGEAEEVWEDLLLDIEKGKLKKRYHKPMPELGRYIKLNTRGHSKKRAFNAIPAETTRGCPFTCDFCSVPEYYGRKLRHHPIEHVIEDVKEAKGKTFIFLDDNILGRPSYAKKLFEELAPLNIKWGGQCSLTTVERHPELLDLAKKSGCLGLYFGLETVSESTMKKFKKSSKGLGKLEDQIKKIKDSGIHFHASIIFGHDEDDVSVFPETLEFLERNKVGTATFHLMTPFPGTPFFDEMKKAGRIITTDWAEYHWENVIFKPKNMTVEELLNGYLWAKSQFSSIPAILRRLPGNMSHPLLHVAANLGARQEVKYARKNHAVLEPIEVV